jgi:hypothetical protein
MIRSPVDIHARSLTTSTNLSSLYVPNFIRPEDVIRVLNRAGIKFVLAGAHALGGWTGAPRATEDVDLVVASRDVKKTVQVLVAAFPNLEADNQEVVCRLRDKESKAVRIDIVKSVQPIFKAALKNTRPARMGRLDYLIPSLEMALAMKFAPMVSPNRTLDEKYQDAADFIRMITNNDLIDLDKLSALGELVYPGGGKEVLEMARRARAGERLDL